mmetsp:Transcript_31607/g.81782  ORF Transcript_31607/g.81782 Transcript_31607/m.81782 type:complete len:411 (+) Transcript_31607:1222-2454(+)
MTIPGRICHVSFRRLAPRSVQLQRSPEGARLEVQPALRVRVGRLVRVAPAPRELVRGGDGGALLVVVVVPAAAVGVHAAGARRGLLGALLRPEHLADALRLALHRRQVPLLGALRRRAARGGPPLRVPRRAAPDVVGYGRHFLGRRRDVPHDGRQPAVMRRALLLGAPARGGEAAGGEVLVVGRGGGGVAGRDVAVRLLRLGQQPRRAVLLAHRQRPLVSLPPDDVAQDGRRRPGAHLQEHALRAHTGPRHERLHVGPLRERLLAHLRKLHVDDGHHKVVRLQHCAADPRRLTRPLAHLTAQAAPPHLSPEVIGRSPRDARVSAGAASELCRCPFSFGLRCRGGVHLAFTALRPQPRALCSGPQRANATSPGAELGKPRAPRGQPSFVCFSNALARGGGGGGGGVNGSKA